MSPIAAYLWGCLIVLAVVIALGEWLGKYRRQQHSHAGAASNSRFRDYVVMAVLWPLFIATVIFIVLWTTLARRSR